MKISARNQLRGTVDNLIASFISRQSFEELGLQVGSEITAVIKSTEVMLMVD